MLGARTKQVYSYGKRNHRIVNATEQPKTFINIFDDVDAPPQWTPLVSRMKKRENTVPEVSPKKVHVHKKKHVSSTRKSPTKGSRLTEANGQKQDSRIVKVKNQEKKLARAPLSPFSRNIPRSPRVPAQGRRGRISSTNGVSLKHNKPLSPLIDVDIIILDDDGNTVAKERRTSRTGVQVNPINQVANQPRSIGSVQHMDGFTEDAPDPQPKRPAKRVVITVYSDDSESEEESSSLPPPKLHPRTEVPSTVVPKIALRKTVVEVAVAPPSYPIRSDSKRKVAPGPQKPVVPSFSEPTLPVVVAPHQTYQYIPSPVARPRQLTPIRRGPGMKQAFLPSPSSTDYDLSLDLEELSLEAASLDVTHHSRSDHEIPAYLKPLLEECRQIANGPADFSSFIETFAFDPILQSWDKRPRDLSFRKIGEASYSEVFGIGDVVLKIIPLRDETTEGHMEYSDVPFPSDAKDVLREIIVTRAMGEICQGFVELLKTYIVRGKYPEVLLRLWDEYHEAKGSESIRPGWSIITPLRVLLTSPITDSFLVSQCYAIIVLPNGGPDLEAYKFINPTKVGWRQASSLFWQVAKSLSLAEQLVSFEVGLTPHFLEKQ